MINDDIYRVPKYHFNKKAAHAFAARFNLFYHKYDKSVKYADVALGAFPEKLLSKWKEMSTMASNWNARNDRYISSSDPSNFLIMTAYSSSPYVLGPYSIGNRYGNAKSIITGESMRAVGIWGAAANLYVSASMWGSDQKMSVPKIGAYFEYTDKVAGIGFLHSVPVTFTAGETLLCRAEAKILQSKLAEGVEDLNSWMKANLKPGVGPYTQEQIVTFYKNLPFMPIKIENPTQRGIKKQINPMGFTVAEGDQENLIQCLLHIRRIETMHDGGRWNDVKRYGIEYAHNIDGQADDVLLKDDPRRAMQIPQDVIQAGLQANPRN